MKPEFVAEVTYAEVTSDGSLRHPSFKGMREDKPADQVVMEMPKTPGSANLDPGIGKEIAAAVGVKLTHPDKVMYPGTKVTKATLAAYYAVVAEKMLPHIQDRPLSLVRDTDGDLQQTFFRNTDCQACLRPSMTASWRRCPGRKAGSCGSMTWLG